VSSLLWAASLLGVDATSEIADAVLLGRSDDAESFSGRVPLWGELLTYAFQRPLCGYGYDAFWTPARVEDVSAFAGWTVPSAHSAYIDTLLSVGFVGAALLAAFAATALCGAVRRYAVGGDPGMAFILGLLVLGLINATMESGFVQPVCISFIAACGAGRLAFCREEMV
jgi:O-antigen ligase